MTLFTLRRSLLRLGAALLVLGAFATAAAAQSLAELAKKEQERRKATGSATKVITNKDLPAPKSQPAADPSAPLPPATPAAAAADEKKADEKKPDEEVKDEAYWRSKMTTAREELRRNEMFQDALQSRINALSTDFVNRDDPYQRAKISDDRQKALAELDRVKADIEKANKSIADIEEEARKAGVPPGWLR
jgi:hypothetical protein